MTQINPYNDVKDVPLPSTGDVGQQSMPNVASMQVGVGDVAFKADQSGIWLGANKFADGIFSVDMNGNLILRDGRIIIQNDSGNTTIDSKGLVSSSNFTRSQATNGGANQVITGTSPVDITGATLTFTLARSSIVVFFGQTNSYLVESAGNTGIAEIDLCFYTNVRQFSLLGSGQDFLMPTYFSTIYNFGAGTYTVKMTGKFNTVYAGTPSLTIYSFDLSYLILGN